MENIELLITIGGSIAAWLASEKFLIPWIVKGWNWMIDKGRDLDSKNIDFTKELKEIEESTISSYKNQIEFLVQRVEQLEHELIEYQKILEELRSKILSLNNQLYRKSMSLAKYRELSCTNKQCPHRVFFHEDEIK